MNAEYIIRNDRKKTDEVMYKFKTSQKLPYEEQLILRAEVQRILAETPEDEELPNLFGRRFLPIDFSVADAMVTTLSKRPDIIKSDDFVNNAFLFIQDEVDQYGARAFENVDMSLYFTEQHGKNNYFDCYFMKTKKGSPYQAWFHKDYRGIVRYYTKSPHDKEQRWAFDAIDLYGALVGGTEVLDDDKEEYLRHVSYRLIREQQDVQYSDNIVRELDRLTMIQGSLGSRKALFDDEESRNTIFAVFNTLLEESKNRTFEAGQYDRNGRAIFFMSTNELVKRVKDTYNDDKTVKKSKTTLNNAVNILAALGFINKLSDMNLNAEGKSHLMDKRFVYTRNGRNPISYFVVNNMPSEYWVKKQLNKIQNKDITLHNVTKARFQRALGKETTDKIFVSGELYVKKAEYSEDRDTYVREFLLKIKENGYVTKEELSGIIQSKNVENRLWTDLTRMTRGITIRRTNKEIRETFEVNTVGGMFVSHIIIHPNQPLYVNTLDEIHVERLNDEFDRLIDEVMYWYGDVFWKQREENNRKKETELFEEFLATGIAPKGLLEDECDMTRVDFDERRNLIYKDFEPIAQNEDIEFGYKVDKEPKDTKRPDYVYEAEKAKPRVPTSEEDLEKAKKAEDFLKRWGV